MHRRPYIFLIVLCFLAITWVNICSVMAQEKAMIKKGDYFPEIPLDEPVEEKHLTYLGIDKGKTFTIEDIKAELILVEIMNINCGHCQKQAPINNKLFSLIESTPQTKGRIKMLSIAVGCLNKYIKEFVEYFKTPYPIVQDPKFVLYDAIGRSSTPLALFVRKDPKTGRMLVVETHSGFDSDYEGMFSNMKQLLDVDLAVIRDEGKKIQARVVEVKPVISEKKLQENIRNAFETEGTPISNLERTELSGGRTVYSTTIRKNGRQTVLFATMILSPSPCDICHDVQFVYLFDAAGKILQLNPVQLTKYGNKHWDEKDLGKIRKRVVGRHIGEPFDFDPEIDAVTSATITSSVIFKSLEQEIGVFKELKEEGLIRIP